ncbi:RNA polymerase, sigma 54 subunit, RpoN/SigL [Nitrosomonas cryotolerans]|uniref:RNA polymerase sigma-54 factor n=1 Tax=Nitrosomonas cryotolerans ATCC 49181 TaxID=1131553 RepID=A0A1N6IHG2_9PROT|nr:RNA polymerase factor sigma-54 [Nitrosomonas cryotolerans]SFP96610.1 RNA polymerase, sigma 54 subunit, RpoN/SigL [Nitrosomonas cryotolerans]SIO31466.1 RNA polymerase, sigma 54 subunit, RpoN/SigL [Nitrosomonas cryotolerans ATCC 49181]
MKPTLQLKLSQQIKLTPQLQQSIRLLQLSTLELSQEIERIMQENPLLEWDNCSDYRDVQPGNNSELLMSDSSDFQDDAAKEVISVENMTTTVMSQNNESDWKQDHDFYNGSREDEYELPQLAAKPISLREHLNVQISQSQISERDKSIVGLLIDSLNDDGYLVQDLQELVEILPPQLEIDMDDMHIALAYLQHLDPSGVGARNLRECLMLQLQLQPVETPYRDQALLLVNEYLEILASRNFGQIKKLLSCDDDCLRSVQQLITHLNPRPGAIFNSEDVRYIVPDVIVKKMNGIWVANLNLNAIPRLSVNRLYANILNQRHHDSAHGLASQLSEAKWLIKNIHQRFSTILSVSSAIVERQQQFFKYGAVAMRPLVLREIADNLNLHESTVSRVTTQKFMHTPRGIFELKYFFGSHVATNTGGVCSATAIRELIKQLVKTENPQKPLSDSRISKILGQQDIVVARRTVAKYRESMQIPPTNLRKSF